MPEHAPIFLLKKDENIWICANCEQKVDILFGCKVHETHISGLTFSFECKPCGLGRPMTEEENQVYIANTRRIRSEENR